MPTNYPNKDLDLFIKQQERRVEFALWGLAALVAGISFYYLMVV